MGINLKKESWKPIVAENRAGMPKCACQLDKNAGKFCLRHGYEYQASRPDNIKTTPEADERIARLAEHASSKMGRKFHKGTELGEKKDEVPGGSNK